MVSPVEIAEIVVFVLNMLFLWLLMKENIWCWPAGGIASVISMVLFYNGKLYAEAVLYFYYVVMAVYGFVTWKRKGNERVQIHRESWVKQGVVALIALSGTFALGWFFSHYTDAAYPYFDAATTMFSFAATWYEARKVLQTWYYWVVINAVSVYLYQLRGLDILALQMVIFALMSIAGLISWNRLYKQQLERVV